jgi:uncharacterized membrane protein
MADEETSRDRLDQLIERVDQLESLLRQQAARLYAIENRLQLPHQAQPPAAARPVKRDEPASPPTWQSPALKAPTPDKPEATPPRDTKPVTTIQRPPETQAQIRPPTSQKPAAPIPSDRVLNVPAPTGPPPVFSARAKARTDLEARIGGNWFNRIGIIAVALGVGFFLKYAFDSGWIRPWARVMIGIAIGLSFLIAGERLRPRYHNYAYGLTGGGILILYLSFFGAYRFLGLLNPVPAFICMAAVTATASLLSARYNALPIAMLGLIGGFLTPLLLSTGDDNEAGLFGYIALLDLGVLALAYSKQWRSLNYMAFIATVFTFTGWYFTFYKPEKLWPTIFFLTVFFSIFALLAVLYNVVNRRPTAWPDLTLVFSNALLYFGASYLFLETEYDAYLGLFAVIVSAFYLALGYFTYERDREDRLLLYTFLGLATLFGVLAVPIQFNQHWVTMCWAIEGAILTWIGLRVEDKTSRYAALVVFMIAVTHWLLVDVHDFAYVASESFVPLINRRALSCFVMVAALAAAASFYKRFGSKLEDRDRLMFTSIYTLGANVLAVGLLSLDANDYFEQARANAFNEAGRPQDFYTSTSWSRLAGAQQLTLSVLWTIYAATALFVAIKRNLKPLRAGALLLLAMVGVKLLAKDLLYYDAAWHRTIANQTFLAFALFVAACALGAWLYQRAADIDKEERSLVLPVLVGAANLFAIIAFSAEAIGHFERAKALAGDPQVANIENMKQLALSAVWVTYGAVSLIVGIKRGRKGLRIASLILLALATLKLMVVDLSYYNAAWHATIANQTFASFALLVVALAASAWFYSRAEAVDEKERALVVPIILSAANLLALVALSAEIMGHYGRAKAILIEQGKPSDDTTRVENTEMMMLSALWIIHGATALVIGIKRNSKWLRLGALGLLTLSAIKLVTFDISYYAAPWHSLIVNQTFAAFALLVLALAVGIYFYSRAEGIDEEERLTILPIMIVAANLLAILALSVESYGHYAVKINAPNVTPSDLSDLRLAQQLSISVIWTVYGGAMLTIGIVKRSRLLRMMALLLLSLTIFKVFLLDLSSLDKIYRIISFIVLGAILLAVSFLYQRYRQRVSGIDDDQDAEAQASLE